MVTAHATANTIGENNRASRESGLLCSQAVYIQRGHDSQTVYLQRGHEHTRTGNWSESGFGSHIGEGALFTAQMLPIHRRGLALRRFRNWRVNHKQEYAGFFVFHGGLYSTLCTPLYSYSCSQTVDIAFYPHPCIFMHRRWLALRRFRNWLVYCLHLGLARLLIGIRGGES